jgi:DNA polymerase-1
MGENKILLIIDTNNMGFMAFGRTPLKHKGVRTEVISIGLAMLKRYLTAFAPDKVVFVYDGGRDVRRTSLYPEYKRPKRPERTPVEIRERRLFFRQLRIFSENMRRLGFTQVKCRGREADDVIYTVVKQMLEDKNFEQIIVVSSDRDFFQLFQLFGNKVSVYHPIRNILYDETAVMELFNVPTEWYLPYRAMVGDSSDNLPGVKGLGPAKAQKIVDMLNRDTSDSRGDHIVSDNKLLLFLNENEKTFELMQNLMAFKSIEREEILAGTSRLELRPGDKLECLMVLCHRYGLQQMLDNFSAVSSVFHQYWQRETSVTDKVV